MSDGDSSFLCSICFKPIRLEQCKIDGEGRAVHEQCQLYKMRFVPPDTHPQQGKVWRSLGRRLAKAMRSRKIAISNNVGGR